MWLGPGSPVMTLLILPFISRTAISSSVALDTKTCRLASSTTRPEKDDIGKAVRPGGGDTPELGAGLGATRSGMVRTCNVIRWPGCLGNTSAKILSPDRSKDKPPGRTAPAVDSLGLHPDGAPHPSLYSRIVSG